VSLARVSAILLAIFVLASWWIIVTPISGVLPEATNHAADIDYIFKFMAVAAMAIFLIVEGFLLYFVLKYRMRPGDDPEALGSNIHGNTRLELVWSAIPALFLIVLSGMCYKVYFDIIAPHADAYVIDVTASQFSWTCTHPEYNVTEYSSCHMPMGEQITLNLKATDVIHSFWVPEFRVKQDAVPGYPTRMHFETTRVGTYHLICAEFCGVGHAYMRANVYVMTKSDFLAWIKQQQQAQAAPVGQVSFKKDIETLFAAHCMACHISNNLGGLSLATYNGLLKGGAIVPGSVFKAGDHKDSVIWKIIQPGTGQPGGNRMPLGGPYLSSHDINTIAAWIDQGAKNN